MKVAQLSMLERKCNGDVRSFNSMLERKCIGDVCAFNESIGRGKDLVRVHRLCLRGLVWRALARMVAWRPRHVLGIVLGLPTVLYEVCLSTKKLTPSSSPTPNHGPTLHQTKISANGSPSTTSSFISRQNTRMARLLPLNHHGKRSEATTLK